jgi:Amt family ammonium transporter
VCAHAFWSSNGFLSAFAAEPLWGSGVIDFAGSGPVHMCGGVAALVMAIILGPRRGRFYDDDGVELDEPKAMGPHSVALQFLGKNNFYNWVARRMLQQSTDWWIFLLRFAGTFALWFGWYGFNPGSSIYIATAASGDVSSLAAVNTTLGSAAGALSGMFTSTVVDERKTGGEQHCQ